MMKFMKYLTSKASRDTSTGNFIPEIDGLRFIAIFSIFLFHISGYLTIKTGRGQDSDLLATLLSFGDIGVPLFFVISGFVIALPFAKGHFGDNELPRLSNYFTRRLSRLEPPYILNLLLLFLLIPLVTTYNYSSLLPNLLASIFYLHNISYGMQSSINCVAWSLEVELQFYILAPFIANIFRIKSTPVRRSILIALIVLIALTNNYLGTNLSTYYKLSILSNIHLFLTGFLLLDYYLIELSQKPEKNLTWDSISVLSWASIIALLIIERPAFTVVPIFVAYCAAFKGTFSNRLLCQPFIYTVGGMCYTIYLYHFTLISAFGRLVIGNEMITHLPVWAGILLLTAFLAPITLLICTLIFIYIEKPCMKKDWYLMAFNTLRARVATSFRPPVKMVDE